MSDVRKSWEETFRGRVCRSRSGGVSVSSRECIKRGFHGDEVVVEYEVRDE
jgi:hypothetical protein